MAKKYDVPLEVLRKYPFASWVGGRGWAGHKSLETARRSRNRAIRAPEYQGYPPHSVIVDCLTREAQ